jgi:putrescine importer
MGRNGVLPKKTFGYVHPKFRTPVFNVILVGVVSLLAIAPSLELISSFINFGALVAFTFVNLSVIAHFVFRQKRYKTTKDIFSYLVMPIIGAGLTGILWANLQFDALIGGIVWIGIGFIYMLFQTRFFKIKIANLNIDDAERTSSL